MNLVFLCEQHLLFAGGHFPLRDIEQCAVEKIIAPDFGRRQEVFIFRAIIFYKRIVFVFCDQKNWPKGRKRRIFVMYPFNTILREPHVRYHRHYRS